MAKLRNQGSLLSLLVAFFALTGCVNVDPVTDEIIPRGNQRFHFDEVKRNADDLEEGLSKLQVTLLLGTPAEKGTRGDVWIYLPERPAVIIPGKALRLEFRNERLWKFGYHAIVLGQRL